MPRNGIPPKTTDYNLSLGPAGPVGNLSEPTVFTKGKILSGFLYLFTLGVFGLGIIYDLFTLNEQIAEANDTPEW